LLDVIEHMSRLNWCQCIIFSLYCGQLYDAQVR
jgi:hypothetical protein